VYAILATAGVGTRVIGGTIITGAFPVCNGPNYTSHGFNITSDTSCGLTSTGDLQSADPLLGALAANGGSTSTQLPSATSPAIDRVPLGTAGLCDGTVATDQRGISRPQGTGCDTGSVERTSTDPS
jgi:hypothetical protein